MTRNVTESLAYALIASFTAVTMLVVSFLAVEPTISHGQDATSNQFTIRQTITDENSFKVVADVVMAGDINGVTGGNATGTTQFVVVTNNAAGYTVEIDFDYTGGNVESMVGDESDGEEIRDYDGEVGGEPSFAFTASTAAQFGYTVTSSTTNDVDQSFLSNAGLCNVSAGGGGTEEADACWKAPQNSGFQIIDTSDAAANGATSTLKFKVHVPNSAVPVPLAETYTATATLSLFNK